MPASRAKAAPAKFTKAGQPAPLSNQVMNDLAALGAKEAAEARTAFINASKALIKYYLESPLADAPAEVRQQPGSAKLELPIHPGPTVDRATGKPAERADGVVILFEGRGYTTDRLWAEYITEQWQGAIKVFKVVEGKRTGRIIYQNGRAKHTVLDGTEPEGLPQELAYVDEIADLAEVVHAGGD